MPDPVTLDIEEGIALLRLNRPERRNAISLEMRAALRDILQQADGDPDIRALILCGSGGSFCAGGDIDDMATLGTDGEAARWRMRLAGQIALLLAGLDVPVIAAVDGPAYGAGFGFAMAADIVLVSPAARFCASFGRLGLVADAGLHHSLPRRVGLGMAKRLIFSAREVGAEEALALGMADEMHPAERLEEEAQSIARGFAKASPTAIGLGKAILNQSLTLDLRQVIEAETAAQALCFTTGHHEAAREAFLARALRGRAGAGAKEA